MRIGKWLVGTMMLGVAGVSWAGDTASNDSPAARCPGFAERVKYAVDAVDPAEQVDRKYSDVLLAGMSEAEKTKGVAGAAAPTPSASVDSMMISGLVQWVENRAKSELRLWVTESLEQRLCKSGERSSLLFPDTCRTFERYDVLSGGVMDSALIKSARRDLKALPACSIYMASGNRNPVGYYIQSIISQYRDGENLEHLLYGFAQDSQQLKTICQGYDQGQGLDMPDSCALVLPLVTYAAAVDTLPYWQDYSKGGKKINPAHVFARFVSDYLNKAGLDGAAHAYVLEASSDIRQFEDRVISYMGYFDRVRDDYKDLVSGWKALSKKDDDESRIEARNKLADIAEHLVAMITLSLDGAKPGSTIDWARFKSTTTYLTATINAYNAVLLSDYSKAYLDMSPILQCLTADSGEVPATCPSFLVPDQDIRQDLAKLEPGMRLVSLLADADSADDFEKTLDSYASPVGAYRRRHEASMWSLNAYLGVEYGEYALNVPDYGELTYNSGEVFAPVGVTWTTPNCSLLGACGLHVQVLNLGVLAGDYKGRVEYDGGVLLSETDTSFRAAVSPGLYFVSSPFESAPFTWGVGASLGPMEYKIAEQDDGTRVNVEREHQFGLFFAVDLVMFSFGI